jgi:hypothetical protein
MPINTLEASKRLKELGFDEDQSEGLAQLLSELDVASATAEDLDDLEDRLKEHVENRLDAAEERIKRSLSNRVYGAAAFVTAVLTIVNYLVG